MKIIPSDAFNVNVLMQNLAQAFLRKNRAAIDLMMNSLYHFKESKLDLIDFYLPQLWYAYSLFIRPIYNKYIATW